MKNTTINKNIRNFSIIAHIDHGKSTLIRAITGINPTRLPEEKKRGMTIDLGYAFLNRPDGKPIGFIDVPGHEKLIKINENW